MPNELSFLSAILVGLLGSTHCLGMCGGIVSAISLGNQLKPGFSHSTFAYLLAYNAGRIGSYMIIAAIAGLLASGFADLVLVSDIPLRGLLSAVFIIALGIHLSNWWPVLTGLERAGAVIWRYIEPWGRSWIPVRNPAQAFCLGLIWGWLPCGLVYAVLAWSMTTTDWKLSVLLMAGFGIGTLPMLFLVGSTASNFRGFIQKPQFAKLVGALVILLGLYTAYAALAGAHGNHSAQSQMSAGDHVHDSPSNANPVPLIDNKRSTW